MTPIPCRHRWEQTAKANPLIPGNQGRWKCIHCGAPRSTPPVQLR